MRERERESVAAGGQRERVFQRGCREGGCSRGYASERERVFQRVFERERGRVFERKSGRVFQRVCERERERGRVFQRIGFPFGLSDQKRLQ